MYEPSVGPPERALDEGAVQIEWTVGRFAVLFEEKREESSAVLVAIRFIDAETLAVSDTVVISDQEGANKSPRSETMAWNGEALGVLWSKMDYEVRVRRVSAQGELLEPSSRAFGSPTPIMLGPLVAANDGFAVAWAERHAIRLGSLTSSGKISGAAIEINWGGRYSRLRICGSLPWDYCLSVAASLLMRSGGYALASSEGYDGRDRVYVALVDHGETSTPNPFLVYETIAPAGVSMVDNDKGFSVAVGDTLQGIFTVGVDQNGTVHEPVKLATDELLSDPLIERVPGGVAMLAVSADPTDGLGTAVHFLSADPASGTVHSRAHLNAGSPPECGVEAKDFARAGDSLRFGVVWIEKCCDERRMYFTMVSASP